MTLRRYVILGAVALIVALLMNAPAASLYAWTMGKKSPSVQLVGLTGQPHEGRVSAVVMAGQTVSSNVTWRLHPLWLLGARLSFEIAGTTLNGSINGNVSYAPGERIGVSDLTLSGDIKPLLAAAGYPMGQWVSGDATLNLARLKLRHNVPVDAEGRGLLHNLTVTLGQPAQLGDFSAEIKRDGDNIVLKLARVSGPLDLDGTGTLAPDGSYDFKLRFKARADAPPQVQNLLQNSGPADLEGYHHVDRRGTLAPAAPAAEAPADEGADVIEEPPLEEPPPEELPEPDQ